MAFPSKEPQGSMRLLYYIFYRHLGKTSDADDVVVVAAAVGIAFIVL